MNLFLFFIFLNCQKKYLIIFVLIYFQTILINSKPTLPVRALAPKKSGPEWPHVKAFLIAPTPKLQTCQRSNSSQYKKQIWAKNITIFQVERSCSFFFYKSVITFLKYYTYFERVNVYAQFSTPCIVFP